jgi:hypothetical protein
MTTFNTEWPFWLEGWAALTSLTVEIPEVVWMVRDRAKYNEIVAGMMRRLTKKVGVIVQFIQHTGGKWFEDAQVWKWEADQGQSMD